MYRLIIAALLLSPIAAAEHALPMWEIEGASNRVFLLGSVHLLREADYPIPSAIYAAYDEAEALYMELDIDDLDPTTSQALVAELGVIKGGLTLEDLLGSPLYAEASTLAANINIPIAMLATSEPWLAAITVEQLMLSRLGFDPANGIEMHLAARAGSDGKEILGLETMADQLGFLDSLSLDAQRDLLMQSLRDSVDIEPMMDGLILAWRHGDVAYLETNMLRDMQEHEELYDAIVVTRNRNWTETIEALLEDDQDYLIVVGALHLIGTDSVPGILERNGWQVTQMRQPD